MLHKIDQLKLYYNTETFKPFLTRANELISSIDFEQERVYYLTFTQSIAESANEDLCVFLQRLPQFDYEQLLQRAALC